MVACLRWNGDTPSQLSLHFEPATVLRSQAPLFRRGLNAPEGPTPRSWGMGTGSGMDRKKRLRSRSVLGTAGRNSGQGLVFGGLGVVGAFQRQASARPSARLTVPALPRRVAGALG